MNFSQTLKQAQLHAGYGDDNQTTNQRKSHSTEATVDTAKTANADGSSNIEQNPRPKGGRHHGSKTVGKENFHPRFRNGGSLFPFVSKYSFMRKPFQQLSLAFGSVSSGSKSRSNTGDVKNVATSVATTQKNSEKCVTSGKPANEMPPRGQELQARSSPWTSNSRSSLPENEKLDTRLKDIIKNRADLGFEYFHENMQSMLKQERIETYRVQADNMVKIQKEITWDMRSIVVDWLIEVCTEYRLAEETLYLAVSMIDRVLGRSRIIRTELQLLAVACVMIASKWFEISPPSMDEWVYICDDQYKAQRIAKMERDILKLLRFQIKAITPYHYLRVWMTIFEDCDSSENTSEISDMIRARARKHMCFAQYCIALCAVSGSFSCSILPSQLVGGILFLVSLCFEDFELSSNTFKQVTSYDHPFSNEEFSPFENSHFFMSRQNKSDNIMHTAKKVHAILVAYSKKMKQHKAKQSTLSGGSVEGMLTPAVYDKYSQSKFEKIADFPIDRNWSKLVDQWKDHNRLKDL